MQAIVSTEHGPPDDLLVKEVRKPTPANGTFLVPLLVPNLSTTGYLIGPAMASPGSASPCCGSA
jgi:hypothetical protein